MELKITKFFLGASVQNFSASVLELGQDAGKITWNAAVAEGQDEPLLTTEEQLQALRDYVKGYGSWSDEEIAAWSPAECNALLIQMISGDIREVPDMTQETWDWDLYEEMANEGSVAGQLFKGDDGEIYYRLEN